MNKKSIRTELKAIRKKIPPIRKYHASISIIEKLLPFLDNYSNVLSFASLPEEINTWPLNYILTRKKKLLLPKVVNDDLHIFHVTNLEKQLVKNHWSIMEPITQLCKELPVEKLSAVLVPGLALDKYNNRIGYGKGYYDRLLLKIPNVISLGICFKEQFVQTKLPTTYSDVKLSKCHFF